MEMVYNGIGYLIRRAKRREDAFFVCPKEQNKLSTRKCGYVDNFLWIKKTNVGNVDNTTFY